jgi:serine/threonine protein kinase
MKQILHGLVYLQRNNIVHRDIKGANVLVGRDGQVKLGDFGLARTIHISKNLAYTVKVVTLWYRCPELLLGFRNYNFGVDIWSAACVFTELVTGRVLFQANQDARALELIFSKCGTPTDATMPGVMTKQAFTDHKKLFSGSPVY